MSNVWFTADTHFGHKAMAAAGKGWRPFDTIEDHDAHLVEQWNSVVRPDDQVWHLGDVGMGSDEATLALVGSLPGHKHLIAGNHDSVWSGHRQAYKVHRRWLEVFESVQPFARRRIYGKTVLLSHFPYSGDHTEVERYAQFRLPDLGDWLIHGHVHDVWSIKDRQINVGVDVRFWRPVHLDEIAAMMGT